MFRELNARQIMEQVAYGIVEPFGERAAWWRTAHVLTLIANIWRKQHSRAYKVADFMPKDPEPPKTLDQKRSDLKSKSATRCRFR